MKEPWTQPHAAIESAYDGLYCKKYFTYECRFACYGLMRKRKPEINSLCGGRFRRRTSWVHYLIMREREAILALD
jgi:hypothetical protein